MIKIYHNLKTNFLTAGDKVLFSDLLWVANVKTDDMNEAFRLSNHIDSNWLENEGVEAAVKEARSTSVGDVFVVDRGKKFKPEVFIVDTIGFKPVVIDYKGR